jgi:hypothetical protein
MGARERDSVAGLHSIVGWRRDRLVAAGFPLPLAAEVARDSSYDLHAVIDLVERGCPPELAARILAPFDDLGRTA